MQKQKNKTFVLRLMSLFVIVLVISAAAILRDGKLFGHDMGEALATSAAVAVDNDTLEVLPDGAIVVNTRLLAKDVQGYGGPRYVFTSTRVEWWTILRLSLMPKLPTSSIMPRLLWRDGRAKPLMRLWLSRWMLLRGLRFRRVPS